MTVGPAFMPDVRHGLPLYLSGHEGPALRELEALGYDVGVMLNPSAYNADATCAYRMWAADNECYSKGDSFDAGEWLCWFGTLPRPNVRFGNWDRWRECRGMESPFAEPEPIEPFGCLFVVAPDVVGDAEATWERSAPWLDTIRWLGFPVAVVAQDGAESHAGLWDAQEEWDVLFVGGSTEWKMSADARDCAAEARLRNKWVHVGRVNSWRRIDCWRGLADSVDGTYLCFAPDVNAKRLARWLDALRCQPALF